MSKIVIFFTLALISIARTNDIQIGAPSSYSRKIYSELKEANPALWTRTDDVIIQAPDNQLISAIYVTDLRDDKDGLAVIESGGIGMKSVTIGLKSPSILRGYKFQIEVYSYEPNGNARLYSKGGSYYDGQYSRKF